MSDIRDPECITSAGTPAPVRTEELEKFFKEIEKTPKVDVIIMSRKTFKSLEDHMDRMMCLPNVLGTVMLFYHEWMGDLVVYGNSKNKVIRRIIETCEGNRPLSLKGGDP